MTTQTIRLRDYYSCVEVNCTIALKKITTNIWNNTYQERDISKLKLAAILYEIGDEKDRSSVVKDITLQDYAYINNRLGIQFKKK